ncbi:hypothetical protein [Bremerella cremea]|uniref:hypothetical protein n=1 Tax=Bremerella cremea TaxID=1031537 RepID=UPI0031E5AF29
MAKTLAFCLIVTIVAWTTSPDFALGQGLLSAASSESRADDPDPPKPKKKKKHHHYDDDCDDDDSFGDALAEAAFAAILSSFIPKRTTTVYTTQTGPTVSQEIIALPGYFSDYPYQHEFGYMLMGDEWYGIGKTSSIRASVEHGNDFQDLTRIGTKLLVEGTSKWGLDMQWDEYFENLSAGGTDQLSMGDINLMYRFGQGYHNQLRFGLGANYLHDRHGSEYGLNFTGGYDAYLGKPWIWSTEFDLGKVGSADLFRFRTTLGLQWKRAEVFAGYQYTNLEGIELDGFLSGLRIWF